MAGFGGAVARYVAGEGAPVARDSAGLPDPDAHPDAEPTGGPYCRACGTRNDAAASFCDSCGTVACLSRPSGSSGSPSRTRTPSAWSPRSRRSTSAATAARTRPRSSRRCSSRRAARSSCGTSTACRVATGAWRLRGDVEVFGHHAPPPRSSGCTSRRPAAAAGWPGGCSPTSRRRRAAGRGGDGARDRPRPARGDRALRVVGLRPRARVRLLPGLAALPLPGHRAADHP